MNEYRSMQWWKQAAFIIQWISEIIFFKSGKKLTKTNYFSHSSLKFQNDNKLLNLPVTLMCQKVRGFVTILSSKFLSPSFSPCSYSVTHYSLWQEVLKATNSQLFVDVTWFVQSLKTDKSKILYFFIVIYAVIKYIHEYVYNIQRYMYMYICFCNTWGATAYPSKPLKSAVCSKLQLASDVCVTGITFKVQFCLADYQSVWAFSFGTWKYFHFISISF